MSDFNNAIADFLEDHGITGVQIGAQTFTIAELRAMHASPAQLWAEEHRGEIIKRPHGWTHYEVTGDAELVAAPGYNAYQIILRRVNGDHAGKLTTAAMTECMRMIPAEPGSCTGAADVIYWPLAYGDL